MEKESIRQAPLQLISILSLLLAPSLVLAERLPIKTYTAADGLGSGPVTRIVRDSRGFLWFCTRGGLSRFDGSRFRTYDERDGLPHPAVNDLLESRSGAYWIATNGGGVCRFDPEAAGRREANEKNAGLRFKVYRIGGEAVSNKVNVLCQDQAGRLWAGTDAGLFMLDEANWEDSFRRIDTGFSEDPTGNIPVTAILADRSGTLWIATSTAGLFRMRPNGALDRYWTRHGLPTNFILSLLEDRDGQLWAGTGAGLCLLRRELDQKSSIVARAYTTDDSGASSAESDRARRKARSGRPGSSDATNVRALYESSQGRLWIGTLGGLAEFDGNRFQEYGLKQGLTTTQITCLTEDGDGNLWIGTDVAGAMKLTAGGFTTYTEADSPGLGHIYTILEDQTGAIVAASDESRINLLEGKAFTGIRPLLPDSSWVIWGYQDVYLDREGRWWVLTDRGLCRFPKVRNVSELRTTRPVVYTTSNGMPGDSVFCIHEDSKGDFWVATFSNSPVRLSRLEPETGILHPSGDLRDLPPSNTPSSFCEDRAGNLWMSFYSGGLGRIRGGRFQFFSSADGLPQGGTWSMYLDLSGRLWFGSSLGGVGRVDDSDGDRPRFVMFTTADGLASNAVRCVTQDNFGRIYVGTGAGVDRLDPATDSIRHFTAKDGLANDFVTSAFRDRQGRLWFGTLSGLSRLIPQPDRPQATRPAFINGLRIGGVAYPVSELGDASLPELTVGSNQNSIQIDFFGIGFGSGELLRYQYRLDGTGQGWSEPTDQRTVNYPALPPGRYGFQVRAVKADGVASFEPAAFSFTILPPLWRRWWFISSAAVIAALLFYALYRYRVDRLLEVERVRTRIAADLHDDIGATLSQIAVLSEVVRKQMPRENAQLSKTLSSIARGSLAAVDSMSDIVWAINPEKDHLLNLTQRMRRLASEVLPASNIEFQFIAPPSESDVKLGANVRREVFLIFKESLNNTVRHSGCMRAKIELQVDRSSLFLRFWDDGRGFDPNLTADGNGLRSMRVRAAALKGEFSIDSVNGGGTTTRLKIPYHGKG
jgi:ligand-binding sensor domain-containing protein/two-component sensor histidine kinase